jgi:hypothetical protein
VHAPEYDPPKDGLPRWSLPAVLPVVLALGFVAGMAIATYWPAPAPSSVQGKQLPPEDPQPQSQAAPRPDSSWQIATVPPLSPPRMEDRADAGPRTGTGPAPEETPPPKPVHFTGPAHDIREARLALLSDFGTYQTGAGTITLDYQQMRQAAMGRSLVGLISVADYARWEQALREDPAQLQAWLQKAAARVQEAAARDRFHLAWAVVDVVRYRPEGFTAGEITPLSNRTYLVIRPLASTVDHTKTEVALRPLSSLTAGAVTPAEATAPWAVYGPVIRFDSNDLYRPLKAAGAKPIQP